MLVLAYAKATQIGIHLRDSHDLKIYSLLYERALLREVRNTYE